MPDFVKSYGSKTTSMFSNETGNRGGVLTPLNAWHRDPLAHRPDVIGQPRRHRGGPLSPSSFVVTFVERSHRPAEVITVHREVSHRLVNPPVLAERVGLANLAGV